MPKKKKTLKKNKEKIGNWAVMKSYTASTIRQASLEQVKYAEAVIQAFGYVNAAYPERRPERVNATLEEIYYWLLSKELEAYRNLFMITTTIGDTETKTAKRKALKRFFTAGMGYMDLLTRDMSYPKWHTQEEEEAMKKVFDEARAEFKKGKSNRRR